MSVTDIVKCYWKDKDGLHCAEVSNVTSYKEAIMAVRETLVKGNSKRVLALVHSVGVNA